MALILGGVGHECTLGANTICNRVVPAQVRRFCIATCKMPYRAVILMRQAVLRDERLPFDCLQVMGGLSFTHTELSFRGVNRLAKDYPGLLDLKVKWYRNVERT